MRSDTHKVLHPIAGKPMLLHLLDTVEALGAERRVVVVGKGREQVEAALAGRGVAIAVQAAAEGTAHAVQKAEEALAGFDGPVLILYGDTPFVDAATLRADARAARRPTTRPAWSCSPARPTTARPMAGSSSARATASPRWSNIRTPTRPSARSSCATAA